MTLDADKDLVLRLEAIQDSLRPWEKEMLDGAHARVFRFERPLIKVKRAKILEILERREDDSVEELPSAEEFEEMMGRE